jgi:hypothetical protein
MRIEMLKKGTESGLQIVNFMFKVHLYCNFFHLILLLSLDMFASFLIKEWENH